MLFSSHPSARVKQRALVKLSSTLAPYQSRLQAVAKSAEYLVPESFLKLPSDQERLKGIIDLARQKSGPKLKYVVVVGIGGSNLGAKAVYDAMAGYLDQLQPEHFPKIFFVESTDPDFLQALREFIQKRVRDPEEILINIVSKSGTTTETAVNADVLFETVRLRWPKIDQRIVVTTDEGSELWQLAGEWGFSRLAIPKMVGGRYSVFSAAGLFPLAAAKLDIKSLLRGAQKAKSAEALFSAAILCHHYRRGKIIHDTFLFNPALESLGKWYRQLLAESLGKRHHGLTPTISIGSTDLHSAGQLYLGGPRDKFTTFVHVNRDHENVRLPLRPVFSEVIGKLSTQAVTTVGTAIYQGVKAAYLKSKLPFVELSLPDLSAASLGEFMQFKMLEVVYLGKFLKVNAFDQPQVELYKSETRRLLRV